MKHWVIILNGPPGSGKDLIETMMQKEDFLCQKLEFKGGIFDAFQALCEVADRGVLYSDFMSTYNDRATKEEPYTEGLTKRDIMIHISETCMKPLFGQDVFGEILVGQVNDCENYVITDGGFDREISYLIRKVPHNVLIFNVYRDGKTFAGDSRSYVNMETLITKGGLNDTSNVFVYPLYHYENNTALAVQTIKELVWQNGMELA